MTRSLIVIFVMVVLLVIPQRDARIGLPGRVRDYSKASGPQARQESSAILTCHPVRLRVR